MSLLTILLPAFVACLVLTGIHTYLGLHVLRRGVIFLDIALAQIAALGITVALFFDFLPDSWGTYGVALAFTILAAALFTIIRKNKWDQEAIIGISFVVSSALAILLADRLPHGNEHIKHILTGNILWVSWPEIAKTAIIYATLGLVHFIYRKKFLAASFDPQAVLQRGAWFWDFLFYTSFGLVITSSVQMGGILLVFCFLIIPALASQMLLKKIGARILFGWIFGIAGSLGGILLSYEFDLPTGPTIVAVFGFMLLIVAFFPNRVAR